MVVPLFGNADAVDELVARIRRSLEGVVASWEVLLVDDGSPDRTLEAALEAAARDPTVGVIQLLRNVGQQRAVLVGLAHARGEWTAVMDGDLQDPPEAIPELLAAARRGTDAVFAGRRGRYEGPVRLFTSRLFKLALSWAAGVPRDAGMFVVLSRRMREAIAGSDARRPFVVAMIGLAGLPVTSLPVVRRPRPSGRSAYSGPMRLATGFSALGYALRRRWRGQRKGAPQALDELIAERYGVCAGRPARAGS